MKNNIGVSILFYSFYSISLSNVRKYNRFLLNPSGETNAAFYPSRDNRETQEV
jgi:hypothetical protein